MGDPPHRGGRRQLSLLKSSLFARITESQPPLPFLLSMKMKFFKVYMSHKTKLKDIHIKHQESYLLYLHGSLRSTSSSFLQSRLVHRRVLAHFPLNPDIPSKLFASFVVGLPLYTDQIQLNLPGSAHSMLSTAHSMFTIPVGSIQVIGVNVVLNYLRLHFYSSHVY